MDTNEKSLISLAVNEINRLNEKIIKLQYNVENIEKITLDTNRMIQKEITQLDNEIKKDDNNELNMLLQVAKNNPDEAKSFLLNFLGLDK